jgi:hypothetical protein
LFSSTTPAWGCRHIGEYRHKARPKTQDPTNTSGQTFLLHTHAQIRESRSCMLCLLCRTHENPMPLRHNTSSTTIELHVSS